MVRTLADDEMIVYVHMRDVGEAFSGVQQMTAQLAVKATAANDKAADYSNEDKRREDDQPKPRTVKMRKEVVEENDTERQGSRSGT